MISYSKKYGAAGAQVAHIQYIAQSMDYVVPEDGMLEIFAGAAGGSGASNAGDIGVSTGGGAGEMGRKTIAVIKGQVVTVAIPAGGASVLGVSGGVVYPAGNDGGDLTVTTTGWTGTLIGGKGGKAAITNLMDGGDGGKGGTGWDLTMPGSRGGSTLLAATRSATGGGAANPCGHPADTGRGGDISAGSTKASSGGGVGGHGGDIKITSGASGGGGYGSSAGDNTITVPGRNAAGEIAVASPQYLVPELAAFGLDYFGGASTSPSAAGGPGAGGNYSTTSGVPAGAGGLFGGGGGSRNVAAGAGGLCAGGGGAMGAYQSGAGGNGYAVFILRRS